jgi:hypothetical protein
VGVEVTDDPAAAVEEDEQRAVGGLGRHVEAARGPPAPATRSSSTRATGAPRPPATRTAPRTSARAPAGRQRRQGRAPAQRVQPQEQLRVEIELEAVAPHRPARQAALDGGGERQRGAGRQRVEALRGGRRRHG